MEEVKNWTFYLCTAILGVLGFGAYYFHSEDTANTRLEETKSKLIALSDTMVRRKEWWDKIEVIQKKTALNVGLADRLAADLTKLTTPKEDILNKQRKLEVEFNYIVKSMRETVDRIRQKAIGSEFPEIILTNGKILRNAKLRKIEDDSLSFVHSDGIGKTNLELLPANIIEMFDLGPNGLALNLEQQRIQFLSANEKENQIVAPNLDASKLQRLQVEMATLDSNIASKNSFKAENEKEVNRLKEALNGQVGTVTQRTLIELAEAKVGQTQLEISKLELELKKLKIKESELNKVK